MKAVLNKEKLFLEMNQSLQRKYQDSFHFFQAKWINDLLDCTHHNPHFQHFVDMRIDIDDIQFLKRYYYHKTPTGKPQIQNRLKVCAQFYANNIAFWYQYPMMIVTNTKSLFVRRAKRMKKIKAEVGSSDETEQHMEQNQFLQVDKSNFLSQLSRSNIPQQHSYENSQQDYDESFYHIYQDNLDKFEQKDKFQQQFPKFQSISEAQVSHLITEITLNSQFKQEQQMPSSSKHTLINIQNQTKSTKQSGISITPIEEKIPIRKQKKSGILSNYLDFVLEKQVSYKNLGLKFQNPAVTEYNSINSINSLRSQNESLERQKEQRTSRRQKIRQKAEELLKRARKDQEVQHKY